MTYRTRYQVRPRARDRCRDTHFPDFFVRPRVQAPPVDVAGLVARIDDLIGCD